MHDRDLLDAAHFLQHGLDGVGLRLQDREVGTEDLHREGALQSRFRLVHRILGRLRVVEDDAGERLELPADGVDELGLGANRAGPLRVRLQADEELVVEETGGIGAVIRPSQLVRDDGDLRKRP